MGSRLKILDTSLFSQANQVITHDYNKPGLNIKAFQKACRGVRFLVRLVPKEVPRNNLLAAVRSIARTFGAEARNPKWTSYGALELDIFCSAKPDLDLFLSAVRPIAESEFAKDLNLAPPHKEEAELFPEARALFNAERYWECHELLEGVWRLKQGEEKRLIQGMILVCAAFVHHQKGEEEIGMGVLRRAVRQLDYSTREYHGFDLAKLRRNVEELLGSQKFANFRV